MRERTLTPEELEELGFERGTAKVDQALNFLLEQLRDGAWAFSAAVRALATERGIPERALYQAAAYVCEIARTPEFSSRTLWRLTDKALEWLEEHWVEDEPEPEPEPEQDAATRFVATVDAVLEEPEK